MIFKAHCYNISFVYFEIILKKLKKSIKLTNSPLIKGMYIGGEPKI